MQRNLTVNAAQPLAAWPAAGLPKQTGPFEPSNIISYRDFGPSQDSGLFGIVDCRDYELSGFCVCRDFGVGILDCRDSGCWDFCRIPLN